jgi:hypothetical protein
MCSIGCAPCATLAKAIAMSSFGWRPPTSALAPTERRAAADRHSGPISTGDDRGPAAALAFASPRRDPGHGT